VVGRAQVLRVVLAGALRPLWQVLTRIPDSDIKWAIVADWAKEEVCQRSGPGRNPPTG